MTLINEKTIGQIVAEDYRTASVFKSYGIDFCCKGNRTVLEVCGQKDIAVETLQEALEKNTGQERSANPNFNRWALDLLVDYIEKKHHRYVHGKIPELNVYLEKLCKVHGQNHPELFEIKELFTASANELFSHMHKEEKILFPIIRAMAEAELNGTTNIHRPPFGAVGNPITMMMQEHDNEGERFRKIAALTDGYRPPTDACTTYRVAFALLEEFEEDLHQHIHLENNILFPKAIELEKKLSYA
jgi:regulator of cell morphogenesis and NO signaling